MERTPAYVEPVAARLSGAIDRHHRLALALVVGGWVAATATAAAAKPFWHDEIFTILVARLSSTSELWTALAEGTDLSAPLNTLLTRGVHSLFGIGHVSTRLPALAGTALMVTVLFAFVRRRAGTVLAVAAVALVSSTAAYRFSYEARGYGLLQGAFALALFSWAEAAGGRRRAVYLPLMTTALAVAIWSHYYGVFALVPIAAGEGWRAFRRQRPDIRLWTAAGVSLLSFAPLLGLMTAARTQSARYWSHASLSMVPETYEFVLHELPSRRLVIASLAAFAFAASRWVRSRAPERERRSIASHEVVALSVWLLLPVVEIAAATLASGAFTPRYALPLAPGLAIAACLVLWRFTAGAALAPIVFSLVLATGFAFGVVQALRSVPVTFVSPLDQRPVLASAVQQPGPIVVTGGLMFLQLWYYTPAPLRGRIWFAADPDFAAALTGSDTIDLGLLALARRTPVNVSEYGAFVAQYPEFRVYTAGSGWLLERLERDGAEFETIAAEPGGRLLRVHLSSRRSADAP